MKVEMSPRLHIHRGGPVVVGNVYSNDHSRHFKVVIAIATQRNGRTPWNNVVCIHIDATGDVVGCSCQPTRYMSEHQDLIGKVKEMPTLKIKWFSHSEKPRRRLHEATGYVGEFKGDRVEYFDPPSSKLGKLARKSRGKDGPAADQFEKEASRGQTTRRLRKPRSKR